LAWVGVGWEFKGFRALGLAWVGEKLVTVLVTVAGVSQLGLPVLASMCSILNALLSTVKSIAVGSGLCLRLRPDHSPCPAIKNPDPIERASREEGTELVTMIADQALEILRRSQR
jgi:hypothetical protein